MSNIRRRTNHKNLVYAILPYISARDCFQDLKLLPIIAQLIAFMLEMIKIQKKKNRACSSSGNALTK